MKKVLIFLAIAFVFNSCQPDTNSDAIHTLLPDLPTSTKLPRMDTTNAFAYIAGTIGDLPFSIVPGKDSVQVTDIASYGFTFAYDSVMMYAHGVTGVWQFSEPFTRPKGWNFQFNLPSMPAKQNAVAYKKRKIELSTPQTFTNIGDSNVPFNDNTAKGNQFSIQVIRADNYNGKLETRLCETKKALQTGSFVRLVSIRNVKSSNSPNYELMYEFDVNVQSDKTLPPVRMKGKAKVWLFDIVL